MKDLTTMGFLLPTATFITLIIFVIKSMKDNDLKVSRVFKRMDDSKEFFRDKYVSKEVCSLLHKTLRDDLREIKTDVKILLNKNKEDS